MELLRPVDAAKRYNVTTAVLATWTREGRIKAYNTVGHNKRYEKSELDYAMFGCYTAYCDTCGVELPTDIMVKKDKGKYICKRCAGSNGGLLNV